MQKELFEVEKEIVTATPAAEFVLRFQKFYEAIIKQPFEYDRKHFIIVSRLIKKHGMELVVEKARVLAEMCRRRTSWFTKDGWADFSIENLKMRWNAILVDAVKPTEEEKYSAAKRKAREHHERVNRLMDERRRRNSRAGTGRTLPIAR